MIFFSLIGFEVWTLQSTLKFVTKQLIHNMKTLFFIHGLCYHLPNTFNLDLLILSQGHELYCEVVSVLVCLFWSHDTKILLISFNLCDLLCTTHMNISPALANFINSEFLYLSSSFYIFKQGFSSNTSFLECDKMCLYFLQ